MCYIVWLIGLFLTSAVVSENCNDKILNAEIVMSEINMSISEEDIRYVGENGTDTGNCSDDETPCKTLLYASAINKSMSSITSLKIKIYPGTYDLSNQSIHFNESKNILIEGSGANNTIIRCGNTPLLTDTYFYENFAFFNCTNIWIRNITFDGCGPYPSAHYVVGSTNVILENNVYQRNTATAVIFYLSSPVYILSSRFKDNAVSSVSNELCLTNSNATNGLFYRDNVTSTGGISIFNQNYTQDILVVNCHFDNNIARNNSEDDDDPIPSQLKRFGRGGGLSVRLVNSNNGFVCVMNSTFTNNVAEVEGGAISLTMADSNNNNITLSNLTFHKNRCFIDKCTGGAFNVDFFAPAQQNKIYIFECNFSNNSASPGSGGAVSIAASDKGFSDNGSDAYALVTIDSCTFEYNKAKFEGTAVGLFFLGRVNQAGFRILIKDCLFENNLSDSKDISALTTYRVLVEIIGHNNKYIGNVGGGVTLLNSRLDVKGRIEFHQNLAVFGGGLALSGRCLILLYENSSMLFEGNRATGSGAAIFVVYPSSNFVLPILNRGCFIQYFDANIAVDLPPQNWKTKIKFVNNSAESGGSAIFTNDLGRCQWLNLSNVSSNTYIFNPPQGVPTPFDMTKNLPNDTAIANADYATLMNLGTDPSSLRAAPSKFNDTSFGETIEVLLSTKDDVGNFRQTVWALNSDVASFNSLRSLSRDKSPLTLKIPDAKRIRDEGVNATQNEGANITLEFMLLNGQGDVSKVTVAVKGSCNPGYTFDNVTELCVCNINDENVVRCDENGRYIYIREGKWGFGENNSDDLITEFTLPVFLKCAGESENGLPGCLFKYDFPDDQCHEGRQGDLCSQCRTEDGYAISLDIQRCVKDDICGVVGVMIFIIICLCFVAFSLAALYYDFTLPNELRGFIFYAQVIGLIYRHSPYVTQSSTAINILVNLLGFSLPIPTCFTKNISALYVALLGLVPPFLVTLVTIIYVLSARFVCVKKLSNRKSIHGMVLLSLFVYKYVADTAFILISCRNLSHKDYNTRGYESVFQYDTNQICTEYPMIIFTVLAFLTVLFFVIPIPILILITSKRHFSIWILKQLSLFRDALNIGVKKELYWFTAWDIFRRIPFVLTVFLALFTPSSLILLIDCLIILFIITVHCVSKPYEKEYINVIEAGILGILFLSTVTILDGNDIYVGDFTSSVLLVIPFVYALIYLSIWPLLWIWDKCLRKYYQKLQGNIRFRFGKSYSVNASEGVTNEFVMAGVEDASEKEDDMQKVSSLNYLREPLLDEID